MTNLLRHLSGIFNGMAIRIDKLCYGKMGEKEFKRKYPSNYNELDKNLQFKDLHKGDRCFILGNAPSLNKQDLSLLKNEQVFTVNYIYKNNQFANLKTNYHFFTDPGCFNAEKHPPQEFTATKTEGNNPICFLPINGGYEYAKQTGLDKMLDIHYLFDYVPFEKPFEIRGDITKGITGFYTVIQTAIIIAVYMGFSEIYLLGCDCTGIVTNLDTLEINGKVRGYCYEYTKEEQEKLLNEYETRIGISDTFSSWTKIFEGYTRINHYCSKKGVKLINATNGGVLDSLPRIDFEKLF